MSSHQKKKIEEKKHLHINRCKFLLVSICNSLIPALSFSYNFFSSSLLSPLLISVPNLSCFTNLITEWGPFLFNIPFKLLRGFIPPVSRVAMNSSWRFSILRLCSLSKISVLFIIIFRESNPRSLFRHMEACALPMWLSLFPRAIAIDTPVLWHDQGVHLRHRPKVIYPERRGQVQEGGEKKSAFFSILFSYDLAHIFSLKKLISLP